MKKAIFLFTVLLIGFVIFTGQKFQDDSPRWTPHPAMTRMLPIGNYVPLPEPTPDNYVNPNTQIRFIYSPQGVMAVSPNYMVKTVPAPATQSEVIITSSLLNPNLVFSSANYFNGSSTFSTPGYISTNGGLNFSGQDITNSNYGDPAPMIDKNNNFIISHITLSGSMGAAYSTNYGVNWSGVITFPGASTSADKNLSGTNYCATSPYYGHSYTVYTEFAGTYVNRIVFTKTTNSGVSWSTIQVISPPTASGHHHQGCDVTAGPEGNVYAVWANCTTNGQNSTEDSLGFAKSTDGGTTWTARNNAADMNGIRAASFGPWGIRVAGFPRLDVDRSGGPRNGWIYVVASEKNFAGGDAADVFLWRSTDQGTTWSAPIRVNQDPANGKLQYHAAINVDANGGINVVYHDCRNSNNNDSVDTYVNRSVDGGNTWVEIKVNDAKFRPAPISGTATGYQGDYIGITSCNNRIFPNWADNRIGRYQSWTCYIDIGPSIAHTPLGNTEQISGNRVVNCVITPAGSGINPSTVQLKYAKNSTSWTTVTMTNSGGQNWTANLPLSGAGTYNYYLTATDSMSRTATHPSGAPSSYHSFIASADTVKPVITHTPIGNTPKAQWPISVSATVTDNIGIDSVWVKWYKRPPNTFAQRQFRLNFVSGNSYAGTFNSTNPEVNFEDTIYYRIFAQDNSSGHNRDSSALYSFKIINLVNVCVGTGTVTSNYPFTTYWMDGRTQMLFTAAELTAGGAGPNSAITKIGFNVISASSQAMNGFSVKFQHTTLTSLTSWVTSGWTNAFSGTYSVPGTGWQYIDLTSPYFLYNGTSNLLVEICYDNSSYTSYSPVNATTISNMARGYYTDNQSGCTMTSGSNLTYRPNTCFTMTTVNNTTQISNVIPTQYSLTQNYPNPFNPVTRINFAIPKQGLVSLKVYDVLGREVKSLVNEVKAPGEYSVDFNGTELSSGVYFYKLESNGFTDIKKMMLIK